MKNIIFGLAITTTTILACNNSNNKPTEILKADVNAQSKPQTIIESATTPLITETKNKVSIKKIINVYLQMKNAFAEDNSTSVANAGKKLETVFKNFDKTDLTTVQKKTFEYIADDTREHAKHICDNRGNIEHQREHFELLSEDIYNLIKAFDSRQILYENFDTIYNNGKGAFWISETKRIKNPYMGKAMLNSGSIIEEIK